MKVEYQGDKYDLTAKYNDTFVFSIDPYQHYSDWVEHGQVLVTKKVDEDRFKVECLLRVNAHDGGITNYYNETFELEEPHYATLVK